jgi:tRNA dimethylallyltransferase
MKKVIFILGPTASGKTALAEQLAHQFNGEILNADVGQFYSQLSIGTAKPDLASSPITQHLFDICPGTEDLNVLTYRSLVLEKIEELSARSKTIFVVGGSLFYVKSLFFVPRSDLVVDSSKQIPNEWLTLDDQALWQKLAEIDPLRAPQIHYNDRYRVARALTLYFQTGELPSNCEPTFELPFEPYFIWLDIAKEVLDQRIAQRTELMLQQGWVEEVKAHATDKWAAFYQHKGLIGYSSILEWIRSGEDANEIQNLGALIARLTSLYAKRQKTFWGSFKKQFLTADSKSIVIEEYQPLKNNSSEELVARLKSWISQ